jgi:hypothetical protein
LREVTASSTLPNNHVTGVIQMALLELAGVAQLADLSLML